MYPYIYISIYLSCTWPTTNLHPLKLHVVVSIHHPQRLTKPRTDGGTKHFEIHWHVRK